MRVSSRQRAISLFVMVLVLTTCILTGCDTKNVGYRSLVDNQMTAMSVYVGEPSEVYAGQTSDWRISWYYFCEWNNESVHYDWPSFPSVTIDIDFGGGAENVSQVFDIFRYPEVSIPVTPYNPITNEDTTYTYKVTVTDLAPTTNAEICLTGTTTGEYTVIAANQPPVIDEELTRFDPPTRTLIVVASDPDGDDLACVLGEPVNNPFNLPDTAPQPQVTVEEGIWTFVFDMSSSFGGIFVGGSGSTLVTVYDEYLDSDSYDVEFTVDPISIPADTLIATPASNPVPTATPVTIVVATGVPANPFQFLNGVGVTVEDDAAYVSYTFNAGVIGGDAGDVDGFWTAMNPTGGFLLPPDNFIQATNIGGGRERWDFNLTPIGGSDQTTSEGALFNFEFEFSEAGLKTLGFQDVTADTVKRTYYSDETLNEYFWGDISNDGTVAPNSIEVL